MTYYEQPGFDDEEEDNSDYQRGCTGCKQRIVMSQRSGTWLPYNLDDSPHTCRKKNGGSGNSQTVVQQQPAQARKPQPPPTITQTAEKIGNNRISYNLTRCFEGDDLPTVCAQHQFFVNNALDYGANIYGSTLIYAEAKNKYSMVVWLNIPKDAIGKLGK